MTSLRRPGEMSHRFSPWPRFLLPAFRTRHADFPYRAPLLDHAPRTRTTGTRQRQGRERLRGTDGPPRNPHLWFPRFPIVEVDGTGSWNYVTRYRNLRPFQAQKKVTNASTTIVCTLAAELGPVRSGETHRFGYYAGSVVDLKRDLAPIGNVFVGALAGIAGDHHWGGRECKAVDVQISMCQKQSTIKPSIFTESYWTCLT